MKFIRVLLVPAAVLLSLVVMPEPAEAGPLRRAARAAGRVASAPFRVLRRAGARVRGCRAGRCG